jgi:osmoprotectant transport system ATP-binding protein
MSRGLLSRQERKPLLATPEPLDGPVSLEARALVCRYAGVVAVDGASLRVEPGTCVALVGESGSGKTTLLRCFNRMVVPAAGTVLVAGADVAALPEVPLRRRIGYVPQTGGLLPHWSVARNVALVPRLLGHEDARGEAGRALARVGLDPATFGERFPHELSGGQRQRAALARALAGGPAVLLMDEPFAALDAITRTDLQAAFAELRRHLRVTTLLVTHDLLEARRLADELVVMRAGRIEQCGTLGALRAAPATPYVATLVERALAATREAGEGA